MVGSHSLSRAVDAFGALEPGYEKTELGNGGYLEEKVWVTEGREQSSLLFPSYSKYSFDLYEINEHSS